MDLSDLAQFTVDEVRPAANGEAVVVGRFSQLRGVHDGWGWLYRYPGPSMTATLEHMPTAAGERVTLGGVETALAPGAVHPGAVFPWVDSRWNAYHVDMILAGRWEARTFAPSAAHYFRQGGVTGWQPVGGAIPEGAEDLGVREGAWDHEHCELCRAHVGGPGDPRGFVDPGDHWLCAACHAKYAVPRDLSFVLEE